jgi:phosphoribosylanthranilate isomerase
MSVMVKICGIRTCEDALAAVEAGADMLGFNFYPPSPRYLAPDECARIVGELRCSMDHRLALVGVFVNTPVAEVVSILDECGLDLAQLHGDEGPEVLAALSTRGFKAIRPGSEGEAGAQLAAYRRAAVEPPGILLDASAAGLYGGSGVTADWTVAAKMARLTPLLLAGGLNPDNVGRAVLAVRPWGVDVASGVESAPAVKDAAKMRVFVERGKTAAAAAAAGMN